MNILVTGGAGFIGSHLCEALLDAGHGVGCVDDLSSSDESNISHLVRRPGFKFHKLDVTRQWSAGKPDRIFHLACPASPVHYQRNPCQTLRTAFIGTMNMLELAQSSGARLLVASTSEVYGDPEVSPQPESYWGRVNPVGVRSCYDEGKRAGEALCWAWRHRYSTDVRVARIFNTYGPRMGRNDGRLMPNIITQALAGEPVTVYGDGTQTRSFCYVSDTVAGLMALMDTDARDGLLVVNVGNPEERTILSTAQDVVRIVGSNSQVEMRPLPQDDPKQRCPDVRLAKELLKWESKVPYAEGLAKTIEWFRKNP